MKLSYITFSKIVFLTLVFLNLNACSGIKVTGDSGEIHYFIVGVGVVSIPDPDKDESIKTIKSQTLGMSISNQPGTKFSLGYASNSVILIPDGTKNYCAEISQKPFGALTVETCKSQFVLNNHEYKEEEDDGSKN